MSSWRDYYDRTKNRPAHPVLELACARVDASLPRTAIDCGCGAGRGIEFLLQRGFAVHGFDLDPVGVEGCAQRFAGNADVTVSQDSFSTYDYPEAALLVASFSLFFCPAAEFPLAWSKIVDSIMIGGVFGGTFLGPNDTWAQPGFAFENAPERKVIVHTESEVRSHFGNFEILEMEVTDADGETSSGSKKHWHTMTVVARKRGDLPPRLA